MRRAVFHESDQDQVLLAEQAKLQRNLRAARISLVGLAFLLPAGLLVILAQLSS